MKRFTSFLKTLEGEFGKFTEGDGSSPKIPFSAKYILCTLNGQTIFIADVFCEVHMAIKTKYNKFLQEANVLGGGQIHFYGPEKGFVLKGSSITYTKADHRVTMLLLRDMFEGQTVQIED